MLFEDRTPEQIKQEMKEQMTHALDTREGSFTDDIFGPFAVKLSNFYTALNELFPIAYIDETSGAYIDRRCAERGIIRRPGTKAQVLLRFSGTDGVRILAGEKYTNADGLGFITQQTSVIVRGYALVQAQAEQIGAAYNLRAGEIRFQARPLSNVTAVTNEQDAQGGSDPESDASLVARYYALLKKAPVSGNIYHYEKWAREADGVGAVKVFDLWNGPGTVKLLIAGYQKEPVDQSIVAGCKAHIEQNRVIGAEVTVESAQGMAVNVSAALSLDESTSVSQVREQLSQRLRAYLQSIAFTKDTIVYSRIGWMLLEIPGVSDYTSLTLNGQTENLKIPENSVPVLGEVSVT